MGRSESSFDATALCRPSFAKFCAALLVAFLISVSAPRVATAGVGDAIFFASDRGHDDGTSAIYEMPAIGGPITLIQDGGSRPVPSPDGSKVLFTEQDGLTTSLEEMNTDGTGGQVLLSANNDDGDYIGSYAWSPDGTKIAYSSQSSYGPYVLFIYDLSGGGSTQLTDGSNPNSGDDYPAWSPDGNEVAYFHWEVTGSTQTVQLNVAPVGGGSGGTLYDYSCTSCGVSYTMGPQAWSPDGTKIAFSFSIPPADNDDIYTVNADGSSNNESTLVGGSSDGEWWPAWSPDGSKLVVTRSDAGDNYLEKLYVMDAATGDETQLTDGGGNNMAYGDDTPAWGAPPAFSASTLLAQYAPQLHYDAQETYRADSASEMTDNYQSTYSNRLLDGDNNVIAVSDPSDPAADLSLDFLGLYYPNNDLAATTDHIDAADLYQTDFERMHALSQYANKMYGRVVPYDDGDIVLEYWFFYYDNPKTFFFVGAHEGDWEMMEIHLNASQIPVEAMYSQHHGGELCGWSHVSLTSAGHPIDYVAEGSHANYYTSGAHNLGYPEVYDYANGDGEIVDPSVVDTASNPSWLAWPGQWGGSDASPTGPAQDPHASQWYDPLAWEANDGNSCTAGERGFTQARRGRGTAARGPATSPPNPHVQARLVGKRVLIRYRFDSWPRTRGRRPWQLITTLQGADPRYVPLTSQTVVRRSSGLIQQRVGLDDRRLRLLVSVRARNGGRSKTFAVPIR